MLLAIAVLITSLQVSSGSADASPGALPLALAVSVAPQQLPPQSPTSGNGRVVVTIALEGVRIPAVIVELRNVDGNVVVGQTTSDAVGQVTFPDVRAGRYVVRATRDGFADAESAPFAVSAGRDRTGARRDATDVRPRERRRGRAGELADREPAAGRGQRRADRREDGHPAAGRRRLPVAPDGAAERHPRARRPAAHQGRRADDRRASDEQRQPQRSVHRRLRSRAAQRRGGVGRGAVEPVRRRVRPILDERDAGAHQARHQRLDHQAGQPDSRIRQGLRVRQQVRAAAVDLRAAQDATSCCSASTCSTGTCGPR